MDKIFDENTLAQSSIFELRNIARELGVYSPTIYKKEELITKMMQIVNGEVAPYVPKSKQGRPPKNMSSSKILDTILPSQEFLDQDKFSLSVGDKTLVLGEHTKAFLEDSNNKPRSIVNASGYFTLTSEGYGLLRDTRNMNDITHCVYISNQQVDNLKLKVGDYVTAVTKVISNDKPGIFVEPITINGVNIKQRTNNNFDTMPVEFALDSIQVSTSSEQNNNLSLPIGKCTLALINKANKIDLINCIKELNNNKSTTLVVLGIEIFKETEMFLNNLDNAEVFATLIDQTAPQHCLLANLSLQRAKRLVEGGKDVVLVVDSIDKVIKNQNLSEGKNLLDLSAKSLESAKQFLGAARKLAMQGSLTVLALYNYKTNNAFDQTVIDELEGVVTSTVVLS